MAAPALTSSQRGGPTPTAPSGLLSAIERRFGITTAGMGVVGVAVAAWLAGRALSSRPILVMAYGLLLLLALAWMLGRRALAFDVERSHIATRVREGQDVDVTLTLSSRRRVTTIIMEEQLPEALGGGVRFPVAALPAGRPVEHAYVFTPRRRGTYEVGPLLAEWSDPFGLTRRRVAIDVGVPVIVHPATESVHDRVITRAWEDPPVRPPVSKPWPTGFEFYGMRDYVPGDDPRRINWGATARSLDLETGEGRYLVREAEQGITDQVNLFLDTDRNAYPDDGGETFELAVRAAASLGAKHLRDGFSVTLHLNGSVVARGLRGRRAELPFLDHLAAVEREGIPVRAALDRLIVERAGNSHNVVITPDLSREATSRLRVVLNRGVAVLLALVMSDDTDPVSIRRAGLLGCAVVEVVQGAPLEKVFRQGVGGRR